MKKITFLPVLVTMMAFASQVSAIVLQDPLGGGDFTTLICRIVNYIAGLIAALAVLMFVIAAIYYVTSAGNPGKVDTAKKILLAAIIGTAIALAASGLIGLIAKIIGANAGAGCGAGIGGGELRGG